MARHKNLAGVNLHPPFRYETDVDPGTQVDGKNPYWLNKATKLRIVRRRKDDDSGWEYLCRLPIAASTPAYASTITLDCANADKHRPDALAGNPTLAVSGDENDQIFYLLLAQGAGGNTVTWWSGITWVAGSPPALSAGAGKRDLFSFWRIASGQYLGFVLAQNF